MIALPLKGILLALAIAAPRLPRAQRLPVARTIAVESARHAIDPLLLVAIVGHESQGNVAALSLDGEDVGLTQLRTRFLPACRTNKDPVRHPSRRCRILRARLRTDGILAIRLEAAAIAAWRVQCRTTSEVTIVEALAGGRCTNARPAAVRAVAQIRALHTALAARASAATAPPAGG